MSTFPAARVALCQFAVRASSSSLTRAASRSLAPAFVATAHAFVPVGRPGDVCKNCSLLVRSLDFRIQEFQFVLRDMLALAHFRAIRRATTTFLFQFARVSYFGSARARETMSWRSDRTRRTSMCASARRRARSLISEGASAPAVRRASTSIAPAIAGSGSAGTLRPWRNAFLAERARPLDVLGPVLERAFARFDFILVPLVTMVSSRRWTGFR